MSYPPDPVHYDETGEFPALAIVFVGDTKQHGMINAPSAVATRLRPGDTNLHVILHSIHGLVCYEPRSKRDVYVMLRQWEAFQFPKDVYVLYGHNINVTLLAKLKEVVRLQVQIRLVVCVQGERLMVNTDERHWLAFPDDYLKLRQKLATRKEARVHSKDNTFAMQLMTSSLVQPQVMVCEVCGLACTKRCQRCKASCYCGPQHQKAHWKIHKLVCKNKRAEHQKNRKDNKKACQVMNQFLNL